MVRNSVKSGAKFGSHKMVFTSGGPDLPEPIGLKLVPIEVAFKEDFYKGLDQQKWSQCISLLGKLRLNAKNALKDYPRLRNAKFTEGKHTQINCTTACINLIQNGTVTFTPIYPETIWHSKSLSITIDVTNATTFLTSSFFFQNFEFLSF